MEDRKDEDDLLYNLEDRVVLIFSSRIKYNTWQNATNVERTCIRADDRFKILHNIHFAVRSCLLIIIMINFKSRSVTKNAIKNQTMIACKAVKCQDEDKSCLFVWTGHRYMIVFPFKGLLAC